MTRFLLVALAALVLAGCGGNEQRAAPPPALPNALASALADRANAVAAALDAGDAATARDRAVALRARAIAAVNAGRIPPTLAEPLLAAVNQLVESIPEPAPVTTEPANDHKEKKKKPKHGNHGGDHDGGD